MEIKFSVNNFLLIFFILFIFAFYPSQINSSQSFIKNDMVMQNRVPGKNIKSASGGFGLTKEDKYWIEKNLVRMMTREKCAQMIVPWVLGKNYSDDSLGFARMVHLVKDLKVGGLIFSNGDALNEAVDINKMQAISDIPLLISADFESGLGMRLSDGTGFFASPSSHKDKRPTIRGTPPTEGVYQNAASDSEKACHRIISF